MVKYKVFEHKVEIDGIVTLSYGIKAEKYSGGRWVVCECVPNVTLSQSKASLLCDKCNKMRLSPVHLKDVCEDFVCELYI